MKSRAAARELERILEANRAQWERLMEDRELQAEIRQLQMRYGLPLVRLPASPDAAEMQQAFDLEMRWIDADLEQWGELSREIDALAERYGVPPRNRLDLQHIVTVGRALSAGHGMGFPGAKWYRGEDGTVRTEIIIDTETAITNPIVQEYILLRLKAAIRRNPPPRPRPAADNPRKLDWRPVWEWHRKHPYVTLRELADLLGYTYQYVRAQMAGYDPED